MRRVKRLTQCATSLMSFGCVMLIGQPLNAQIVTDGQAGAVTQLTGDVAVIGEELGTRRGRNLFHSFEHFGIGEGGRAEFRGAADIERIIARVSGGESSLIDGELAVTIPAADLWFFNPAGIALGPNASFDLSGDLMLSTADRLDFADGSRWSTTTGADFGFTVAQPESFGFLGGNQAALSINGSQLQLADQRSGQFSSNQLTFEGARLDWQNGALSLMAPDGTITVGGGSVLLAAGADAQLMISGNALTIDGGSAVAAFNDEARSGIGRIDLIVDETAIRDGAVLLSESSGGGSAAPITIQAERLVINNFGFVSSNARGEGAAGKVNVQAQDVEIGGGSFISSETFATGRAGDLDVRADMLTVLGREDGAFTGITSQAAAGSTGNSGNVSIQAGDVSLNFGVLISSDTFAQGNAGRVEVNAQSIVIAGEGSPVFTAIASLSFGGAEGNAGSVAVKAEQIELRDGGQITAATLSDGAGGDISVQSGSLLIDSGGSASLTGISSDTVAATAGAGDVTVNLDTLEIRGAGVISSTTFGGGDAGTVTVTANQATLDRQTALGFAGITSQANAGSTGNAGLVEVTTNELSVFNGATINSSTFGSGDAGLVGVRTDRLEIAAETPTADGGATGIFSDAQSGSSGDAGRVEVRADDLELRAGGQISSQTLASGDAGTIDVNSGAIRLIGGAIASSTTSSGAAGSVLINAETIDIGAAGTVSSRSEGSGPAGNIQIKTTQLELANSAIETSGRSAQGGRIDITALSQVLLENSTITSTGIRPAAGASLITVTSPSIVLNRARVESLFDEVQTADTLQVSNSGEANLLGDVTIISVDSVVAAGTSVDVTGLDSDIATDLVGVEASFVNRNEGLTSPCNAAVQDSVSSFSARLSQIQQRSAPDAALSACH